MTCTYLIQPGVVTRSPTAIIGVEKFLNHLILSHFWLVQGRPRGTSEANPELPTKIIPAKIYRILPLPSPSGMLFEIHRMIFEVIPFSDFRWTIVRRSRP